jgi:UDP-N-acetylglucosamine transferase subunit ALG13
MQNKKIFVTVGTTKFDELINTVTNNDILQVNVYVPKYK